MVQGGHCHHQSDYSTVVQRLEDTCLDSQSLKVSELEFELWVFLADKSRFFHTVL